jgi:hypothetical protein
LHYEDEDPEKSKAVSRQSTDHLHPPPVNGIALAWVHFRASETGWGDVLAAKSQNSPQGFSRAEQGPRRVFRDRITPHWFADNTRFWYRDDLGEGAKEFALVDAQQANAGRRLTM